MCQAPVYFGSAFDTNAATTPASYFRPLANAKLISTEMTKAATLEKKKAIGANGSKYPIMKYPTIWNNSALTRAAINEAIKRRYNFIDATK